MPRTAGMRILKRLCASLRITVAGRAYPGGASAVWFISWSRGENPSRHAFVRRVFQSRKVITVEIDNSVPKGGWCDADRWRRRETSRTDVDFATDRLGAGALGPPAPMFT